MAAGEVDEALELCAAQVDEWVGRLAGDSALRGEYNRMWSEQRKYAVSVLLPNSSLSALAEKKAAAAAANGKGGAKGGKGEKGAPPPQQSGAEKAKSKIEQLMAEVSREVAARKASAPARRDTDDHDDSADDEAEAPKVRRTAGVRVQWR